MQTIEQTQNADMTLVTHDYSGFLKTVAEALKTGAVTYLPDLPKKGETWLIALTEEDARACEALGYNAAAVSGANVDASLFEGCDVIFLPRLDEPSFDLVSMLSVILADVESVRVAYLPGETSKVNGISVCNVIEVSGRHVIDVAVNHGRQHTFIHSLHRPTVSIQLDYPDQEAVDNVIAILSQQGFTNSDLMNQTYQQEGKLVAIFDLDSGPRIAPLTEENIRERIRASVDLVVGCGDHGFIFPESPQWLIDAILGRSEYEGVRVIEDVVQSPTAGPDGSLLRTVGYDQPNRLVYVPKRDEAE